MSIRQQPVLNDFHALSGRAGRLEQGTLRIIEVEPVGSRSEDPEDPSVRLFPYG